MLVSNIKLLQETCAVDMIPLTAIAHQVSHYSTSGSVIEQGHRIQGFIHYSPTSTRA